MTSPADRQRLNVFYISPGGAEGRGGMGRMAKYFSGEFAKMNSRVKIRVLDPYGDGAFFRMIVNFTRTYLQVLSACLTRRVDVVHVHMSFGGSAVRKLALVRLAGWFHVSSVLHIHGSEFQAFCDSLPRGPRRLLVSSMNAASRIVVIGAYWERYLVDVLGISESKISIIRNGVPWSPLSERHQSSPPCRIVALGILSNRKGTSDLLRALAALTLPRSTWVAVIAGNGDVDYYRREAEALGLADSVQMPGWIDAQAAAMLLRSADIFLLPSYNEGLPVAILEAMAAGLPVIATPVGAVPEAVIADENGILIEPGNVEALSAAIGTLVKDPALRLRLGHQGRRLFEEKFTIEHAATELERLYERIAGTAKTRLA